MAKPEPETEPEKDEFGPTDSLRPVGEIVEKLLKKIGVNDEPVV